MRVLWLGHFVPYPPRGGAPQRSYHLLRSLSEAAEVHFCGLSQRAHQPRPDDIVTAHRELGKLCKSVRIVPLPFRSSRGGKVAGVLNSLVHARAYSEAWLDSRWFKPIALDAIRAIRPDIVHVDSIMIASVVPREVRASAVLNHHNIESQMMLRRSENCRGIAKWFFRRESVLLAEAERVYGPQFSRHLVVSKLDGARLAATSPDAAWTVVANGVDTDYFRPLEGIDELPSRVVFTGRMNWYPNEQAALAFLSELWPKILTEAPEARFVIAGMNPTARLQMIARRHRNVEVTGFVADIRPVVAAASVYVCPILDGGGTRLKILDAMAMGKAIVGTPLAVEGLELGDGCEAVVRDFGATFVKGVLETLADPALRSQLGQAARLRAVREFDWRVVSGEYLRALGVT